MSSPAALLYFGVAWVTVYLVLVVAGVSADKAAMISIPSVVALPWVIQLTLGRWVGDPS